MDIVLDFDGTVVTHEFPIIGKHIGAVQVLKELTDKGHRLILFTMRCNKGLGENYLDDAIEWFSQNAIPLYGVQSNPTQCEWTSSPKAYGQIIIDDTALGAPLINNGTDLPYIDWLKVKEYFNNLNNEKKIMETPENYLSNFKNLPSKCLVHGDNESNNCLTCVDINFRKNTRAFNSFIKPNIDSPTISEVLAYRYFEQVSSLYAGGLPEEKEHFIKAAFIAGYKEGIDRNNGLL